MPRLSLMLQSSVSNMKSLRGSSYEVGNEAVSVANVLTPLMRIKDLA